MKKLLISLSISLFLLSLTGCNTVNGFGHDVSSTGHAISHAAN